jgi:hypothetical protein
LKTRNFYLLLSIGCILSYLWITYCIAWKNNSIHADQEYHVCLFKQVTGIPCPSCGTSRSLVALIRGDFQRAVRINPLGILAALLLVLIPSWMLVDLILRRATLERSYVWIENNIKAKAWIWAPMILLISANWMWNIMKGV